MKITIEPTKNANYPTCSISVKGDDLTIENVLEMLVCPALVGVGFTQELVSRFIKMDF